MMKPQQLTERRTRRRRRVRARITGTQSRPRLSVFRSNRYTAAQLIDDASGRTILSDSTKTISAKTKTEAARLLGERIAEAALKKGVMTVVFDRNGYAYHGRVAAVADGARSKGLTL